MRDDWICPWISILVVRLGYCPSTTPLTEGQMPLIELLVAIPYSPHPSCPKRGWGGGALVLNTNFYLVGSNNAPENRGVWDRRERRGAGSLNDGSFGGRRGICMSDERKRGQGETDARVRGKG